MARPPIDTDALLKRLAALGANQTARNVGRTSAQSQPRFDPSGGMTGRNLSPQLQIGQNKLADQARALRELAPQYKAQIEQIAAGGAAATGPQGIISGVLGSPVVKPVLEGFSTIGIPLRAVTSTLKEARDALDDDPNTRAGMSDWYNQIKDPSFGFGRVVPMEGWKGRLVGFAGDLVLDPVNYLTLGGGSVIKGARIGAQGALRAGVKETAEKVALNTALGLTKETGARLGSRTVSGRAGREVLADIVRRFGGEGWEVKNVLARGKSAVPKDIAEYIGLGRSGIYVVGTKLRLPGSGPLADAIESGLIGLRLAPWAGGSKTGRFIRKWITPRGTGSVGVRDLRIDAAMGKIAADEATTVSAFLASDSVRRTAASIAKSAVSRRVAELMVDPNIEATRTTVFRLLENENAVASQSERAAAARIKEFFKQVYKEVDDRMSAVDPGWKAGEIKEYFPHMITDDARKAMESSFDNPKFEQLMTYLKIDPRDLQGSLKRRSIGPKTEFMGVKGEVHMGTVEGINKVTREQLGFDLFETDVIKVMAKYTDVVAESAGTAAMLNNLKDAGVLKMIKERGIVDEEFLVALQKSYDNAVEGVDSATTRMQSALQELVRVTGRAFDPSEKTGVLGRLVRDEKVSAQQIYDAARRLVQEPEILQSKVTLALDELNKAVAEYEASTVIRNSYFSEQNTLIDVLTAHGNSIVDELKSAAKTANELRSALARGEADVDMVAKHLADLRRIGEASSDELGKFQNSQRLINFLGNDFGPELQRLTEEYGSTFLDEIIVDGQVVSSEMIPVRINYPDVPAAEQLMGEIFDPRVRTYAVIGGTIPSNAPGGKEFGLGENWVRATIAGEGTASRAVFDRIEPRFIDKSKILARRGEQGWTVVRANNELVRGVTIADNDEGLVQAFYWMTLREMKAAYVRGGTAAQEAFAQELLAGVTPRARLWNEASEQVRNISRINEMIRTAGAKSIEGRGTLGAADGAIVDAATEIVRLRTQLDNLDKEISVFSSVASGTNSAAVASNLAQDFTGFVDQVVASGLNESTVFEFKTRAIQMLEALPDSAFPEGRGETNTLIQILDTVIENQYGAGQFSADNLRRVADEVLARVEDGVRAATYREDPTVVGSALKQINQLTSDRAVVQSSLDKIIESKGANPFVQQTIAAVSGDLRDQIAGMADTLANYYIFHEAYLVAERAQSLLPPGVVLPESVWSVTVRNVAKEQSRQIGAFRSVVEEAYETMATMQRDILDKLPRQQHAEALQTYVRNLPEAKRDAVEKMFGILDSGVKTRGVQELDKLVNVDPEYVGLLNELKQIEVGGASAGGGQRLNRQPGRNLMNARTLPEGKGARQGKSAEEIASSFDARSLKNKARVTVDSLQKKGLITKEQAIMYRQQIDSIRTRVKAARDAARAEIGARGSIRDTRTSARGRSKFKDTYGVAGLFDGATFNIAKGTGRRVEEFFARTIGGGKVYTGVGGKYRRGGTFGSNTGVFMGEVNMTTLVDTGRKDQFGKPIYDVAIDKGEVVEALERQYRFISREDSIIGRMESRLARRQNMLGAVALDPTIKAEDAARVGLRLTDDKGNLLIMGDAGYAAYLNQRIADAEAAVKMYREFEGAKIEPYRKEMLEPKTGAAAKKMTEADRELERMRLADYQLYQMSQNPDAIRWIDETLATTSSPVMSLDKKGNVVFGANVILPPKELNIPEKVVEAIKNIADARAELAAIEARPTYLAAQERRRLHDFIRNIADYDFAGIRNANGDNVIDVSPAGSTRKFMTVGDEAAISRWATANNLRDSYTVHIAEIVPFNADDVRNYLSGGSDVRMVFTLGQDGVAIPDNVMTEFVNFDGKTIPQFASPNDAELFNILSRTNTVTVRTISEPIARDAIYEPSNAIVIYAGANALPSDAFGTASIATIAAENAYRQSNPVIKQLSDALRFDEIWRAENFKFRIAPPVDESGNLIKFDALETRSLYSRPRTRADIQSDIGKLRAKRAKLETAIKGNRGRNEWDAVAKKTAEIKNIDTEIAGLNSQLIVNDPNMQMAQVQKAHALKNYFEQTAVQEALGFQKTVSAHKAVERYLQLHPEANVGAVLGDERKATLLEAWKNSFESSVLRTHAAYQQAVADNSKILKTARYGGAAREAVETLEALRAQQRRFLASAGFSHDALLDVMASKGMVVDIAGTPVKVGSAEIASKGATIVSGATDVITPEEVVSALRPIAEAAETRARTALGQPPQLPESLRRAATEVSEIELQKITDAGNVAMTRELLGRLRANLTSNRAALKKAQEGVYAANERLAAFDIAVANGKPVKTGNKVLDDAAKQAINAKAAAEKALKAAETKVAATEKKVVEATARYHAAEAAMSNRGTLVTAEQEAFSRVQGIKALLEQMKTKPPKVRNNVDWQADFAEWTNELEGILSTLDGLKKTAGQEKAIAGIRAQLVQYAEIRTQMLANMANVKDIEIANAATLEKIGLELLMRQEGDVTPVLGITFARQLEEGFKEFSAQFPGLQGNAKIMEIFENANRLKDPAFARAMQRFLSPYTKFFKAWAVATPGFHLRNSVSNAFMLIAAGGRPDYLFDGLKHWRGIVAMEKTGKSIDDYIEKLSAEEAQAVRAAFDALHGAGGGMSAEFDIQFGNKLYSNKFTKFMQKTGASADDHARFMLAYDGTRGGMDYLTAAARVRRFMVDYNDTSSLDAMMRQIVPFWMWTSRNLPLQMVNIWQNPRAYRVFNSFKNNFEDRESGELMPKWMKETGAFMIPGSTLAVTPDLPFSRIGQQIEQLRSPKRLAADVNPILRVPLETMLSDKKFFSDTPFQEGVTQKVSGPVGLLASYLGQPFGQGATGPKGERLVSDRFLYGLTNLLPLLNQAERLVPSRPEYQERGITNQLLGYFGVPIRQVTQEMQEAELRRRLRELSNIKRRLPEEEEM